MEENLPQPQVPVPPKKFPLKWILIVALIITIFSVGILFAPIPYYGSRTDVACIMMVGAPCPPRAWQLGPSLWQKITAPQKAKPLPPNIKGQFCGGIANIECASGYKCQLDGSYPDAGGKCVKVLQ